LAFTALFQAAWSDEATVLAVMKISLQGDKNT